VVVWPGSTWISCDAMMVSRPFCLEFTDRSARCHDRFRAQRSRHRTETERQPLPGESDVEFSFRLKMTAQTGTFTRTTSPGRGSNHTRSSKSVSRDWNRVEGDPGNSTEEGSQLQRQHQESVAGVLTPGNGRFKSMGRNGTGLGILRSWAVENATGCWNWNRRGQAVDPDETGDGDHGDGGGSVATRDRGALRSGNRPGK
jgi:hypothetical protein